MSKLNFPVEEFTTPNPITATEETQLEDLNLLMKENSIRHLPIIRGTEVVGVVSDRDLRMASGLTRGEKKQVRACDIMATDPVTVSAGATLDEVALEMSKKKIGSVVVNDENDKFYGIFTVTDALNALIEIARASEKNERMD